MNGAKPLRVMVLGVRGIPGVQGGVETHAEQLYPRLAKLGCDIEVLVRSPFVPAGQTRFGDIRLRRLWAPARPGVEAFVHSLIGVLYAAWRRPDVLHIHAIGPAIVTPLARLLGLRVVVTHHGPDYDRDKWGPFARWVLRTGERLGMKFSNQRIVISKVIADLVREKYSCESVIIPNGVNPVVPSTATDKIERFGLEPGKYFLQVSRMVPEKRQLDLIRAFAMAKVPGWKLALVGGLTDDEYSRSVRAAAAEVPGVVLTDFQKGEALAQLYSHAGVFVLPSSHEGLPIAILEALSYRLPVIASAIAANVEVGLSPDCYFACGDIAQLSTALARAFAGRCEISRGIRANASIDGLERYDWSAIARRTLQVISE